MGINFASRTRRIGSMLAEKFDMLLRDVPGFIDMFRVFGRTPREFFGFVLDLGMKPSQNGENGPFDVLLRLQVRVCNSLLQKSQLSATEKEKSDRSAANTHNGSAH